MAMFGGMESLLGPMLEKFKKDMDKARAELKEMTVEASSGGGMVTAKANGEGDLLEIKIAPEAMEDAEMLQDMIVAAVREVQDKAKGVKGEKLGGLLGGASALGLDVDGLF